MTLQIECTEHMYFTQQHKKMDTNLLRSHLRCVTQDCDRPFSTPNNNDQQMLRNFDVFNPPLTAA